jgi:hypothetical protein
MGMPLSSSCACQRASVQVCNLHGCAGIMGSENRISRDVSGSFALQASQGAAVVLVYQTHYSRHYSPPPDLRPAVLTPYY